MPAQQQAFVVIALVRRSSLNRATGPQPTPVNCKASTTLFTRPSAPRWEVLDEDMGLNRMHVSGGMKLVAPAGVRVPRSASNGPLVGVKRVRTFARCCGRGPPDPRSFTEGFEERALTNRGQERGRFPPRARELFFALSGELVGARFLCGCRAVFARSLWGSRTPRSVSLVVLERNFLEILSLAVYLRFHVPGGPDDVVCRVDARFL